MPIVLILAGCDSADPERQTPAPPAARSPPNAAPSSALPPGWEESRAAADALKLYYALIGARRYREAWRLRAGRDRLDYDAFAASFDRYADYRATVGMPSQPAEAGGMLFVNISVQLYGSLRDGSPFGSVGAVTMQRSLTGGDRGWKIGQ